MEIIKKPFLLLFNKMSSHGPLFSLRISRQSHIYRFLDNDVISLPLKRLWLACSMIRDYLSLKYTLNLNRQLLFKQNFLIITEKLEGSYFYDNPFYVVLSNCIILLLPQAENLQLRNECVLCFFCYQHGWQLLLIIISRQLCTNILLLPGLALPIVYSDRSVTP